MKIVLNLIGKRFGILTPIKFIGLSRNNKALWLCKCDCGQEKIILSNSLTCQRTKSCGCRRTKNLISRATHGHCRNYQGSKIYKRWCGILTRCFNINEKSYKDYGGRGIIICERWLKFENFLEDMGEPPTSKHQIDRIDNNLGYYKENCRWILPKENGRNKRNNHLITFKNKTQCLSQWSDDYNIKYQTLYRRICRDKWPIEKALTTPIN